MGMAEPWAFARPAFDPRAGCVFFWKKIAELDGSEVEFLTPDFFS